MPNKPKRPVDRFRLKPELAPKAEPDLVLAGLVPVWGFSKSGDVITQEIITLIFITINFISESNNKLVGLNVNWAKRIIKTEPN